MHKLLYTDIPRYTEQIQRFYDAFGPENVHIIIYDDFNAHQQRVVRETFAFLGVDPDVEPTFAVVNSHGQAKSKAVQSLIERPPGAIRRFVRSLIPMKFRSQLRHSIRHMNTRLSRRAQLAPALRARLNKEFAPEVRNLSDLLSRDLTHWTADEPSSHTRAR